MEGHLKDLSLSNIVQLSCAASLVQAAQDQATAATFNECLRVSVFLAWLHSVHGGIVLQTT